MSRFLVTGGSGFIGSTLVRRLIEQGHQVLNLDAGTYAAVPGALDSIEYDPRYELISGSITDRLLVDRVLANFRPSFVINLAAESHVDRSIDGPAPFVDSNVIGVVVLLEAITAHWSHLPDSEAQEFRFVHVSTDEVFGSLEVGMANVATKYDPSSPYAATKAASDHLIRAWHRTYGLPAMVINSCNNYGPYQFPEKLIPLAIARLLSDRTIPLYGDGRQTRDWIHVDDHCRGLMLACEKGNPGETYLIGARAPLANIELIELVCHNVDRVSRRADGRPHRTAIEYVTDRPGHDRRYAIDPTSIEELGFAPVMGLEQGIASTVDWYVENQEWWRPIMEQRYDTKRLGLLK